MLQGIGARESKNLWADFSYQAALIDCDLLEIFSSKLVKDFLARLYEVQGELL